jgi:DNA-binding response OmpR family regulator
MKTIQVKPILRYKQVSMPANITILVIDDDPEISELIIDQLKSLGFCGNFFSATNLYESQRILKTNLIDFILSDWHLPDGEGIDLLTAARKSNSYKVVPFVMVTAEVSVDAILKAKQEGISEYLYKPCRLEDLREKVFSAWSNQHTQSFELVKKLTAKNYELEQKIKLLEQKMRELDYEKYFNDFIPLINQAE